MRNRSAFLYMEPSPDTDDFAACMTCVSFIPDKGRCLWFSDDEKDEVDGDDTCGLYVQGEPESGRKPSGLVTKEAASFLDRRVTCKRCNAFDDRDKSHIHCDLYVQLNRMFPNMWSLIEGVKPNACCNAWDAGKRDPKNFGPYGPIPDPDDPKVGGMITKLVKQPERQRKPFGSFAP